MNVPVKMRTRNICVSVEVGRVVRGLCRCGGEEASFARARGWVFVVVDAGGRISTPAFAPFSGDIIRREEVALGFGRGETTLAG